jgi:hypothetical protein
VTSPVARRFALPALAIAASGVYGFLCKSTLGTPEGRFLVPGEIGASAPVFCLCGIRSVTRADAEWFNTLRSRIRYTLHYGGVAG